MKVLVIGSGGREHAICHAFAKDSRIERIYCAPGNAGIASVARCVNIPTNSLDDLRNFAESKRIDMTFVGPEGPLVAGVVDEFDRLCLPVIGPSKSAARLEGSKSFAKDFMRRHNIPTAAYHVAHSIEESRRGLEDGRFGGPSEPIVVKADGLAAGKGVVVADDRAAAIQALAGLEELAGRAAASTIVLEECLTGGEVSLLLFSDGKDYALMPACRDHKRIGDGDTGPNTGGMGTISDGSLLTPDQLREIEKSIVEPTLRGCSQEGFPFKGVLFIGLMMTDAGPKVLEFNTRFGDPETQSILVRLETDLAVICKAIVHQDLSRTSIEWHSGTSACVVLAADGYPAAPVTGDVIHGLDAAGAVSEVKIFHAGTAVDAEGRFVTAGGRVLGVTAIGDDLDTALDRAYQAVSKINFRGMQFRRDIGS
jgi:phosphoribosylamine---glycine ligase